MGLPLFNIPIQNQLEHLKKQLENNIQEVNEHINSGENKCFKILSNKSIPRWTLKYPSTNESINHPFFDKLNQVDIGNILYFVNSKCHFMKSFHHMLERFSKQRIDLRVITAALVAWGTNMGIGKMSENSDIDYQTLSSASDNLIRLDTLKNANDIVSDAISEFSIFRYFDISDFIHSSSDGQKYVTSTNTINARHSPKYFGLKKGIVSYTLLANHIPINAQIIGTNEHESHYVFDLLFNNTSTIQPEVHSTDTHGTNEINFAILHIFGYQFAPRGGIPSRSLTWLRARVRIL